MDITNRDVREITMSKDIKKQKLLDEVKDEKPVKSKILTLPILIIGFLVVVFGAYMLYAMTHKHVTSKTETSTVKTSSNSEKASSSNKKYVAGKDYKVTYSNTNLIDKATIQKGLKASYLTDINDLMNTDEQTGSNMAKIEVYYNKDKNLLVERLFKNGYKDNQPTQTVGYDLQKQSMNLDKTFGNDYLNQPLVYTWEKLSK